MYGELGNFLADHTYSKICRTECILQSTSGSISRSVSDQTHLAYERGSPLTTEQCTDAFIRGLPSTQLEPIGRSNWFNGRTGMGLTMAVFVIAAATGGGLLLLLFLSANLSRHQRLSETGEGEDRVIG